jgi:hypothetical protein
MNLPVREMNVPVRERLPSGRAWPGRPSVYSLAFQRKREGGL